LFPKRARQEKEWNGLALLKPLASQAVFISAPPPDFVFAAAPGVFVTPATVFLFAAAPSVFVAPALFLADTIVVFHRVLLDWPIAPAPPLFMMGGFANWRYEDGALRAAPVERVWRVSANSGPAFHGLLFRLLAGLFLLCRHRFSSAGRMARLKCGGG
jgi:hypothetical protein